MISIILPAARRSSPEDAQVVWGDLRVALASIAAYAPELDVVVGWSGLEEPRDLPPNPRVRLLRQAEGITTGSEAWNWCAAQTDAEELLILGDDCVLHPDAVRLLQEDVEMISRLTSRDAIGLVGARSNYVKASQNIRQPNGSELQAIRFASEDQVFETDMVVPVAAWIDHTLFDRFGGFPATNWFADDLFSWDLAQAGYTHYVSRAYVHHVGERGTGQGKSSDDLLREGVEWLRRHRPDFLRDKLGVVW